ncbi:MAG: hypothetical protein ABIP63_06395 [Thermoanaerobaculia bacterium]
MTVTSKHLAMALPVIIADREVSSVARRAIRLAALSAVVLMLTGASLSAHPAWGIVVDRRGQVFFSDLETVWKIDAHGGLSVARTGISGRHVHELAIDAMGNVSGPDYEYVSERAGYRTGLWRMDPAGRVTYLVQPTLSPARGASIWRDRAGNSYAVESNNHLRRETLLIKRSATGEVSTLAGGKYGLADGVGTQAQFSNIIGVAFDGASLIVTDGTAVRRVTMSGTVATVARDLDRDAGAHQPLLFGGLFGLTAGPHGDVYVADFRNRRVLRIAASGVQSVVLRSEPPWSPTGVALAPNGDLYVLENGFEAPRTWRKPRVRRLSPSGAITTAATVK